MIFALLYENFWALFLLISMIIINFHPHLTLLYYPIYSALILKIIINCHNKIKWRSKKKTEFSANGIIFDVSVFPSGNILLLTQNEVKILNNEFNLLQEIKMNNSYGTVDIKDENNFLITSLEEKQIKTYKKENNIFIFNQSILNLNNFKFAQYFSNHYLIAVCEDELFIFKENNLNYKLLNKIKDDNYKSILLIKSKNVLITANENNTKFRNIKTYAITKNFDEIKCKIYKNGIANIDNERIIILSTNYFYYAVILSITKKEIIEYIRLFLEPILIHSMERKNFFFIYVEIFTYAYNKNNYKYLFSPSLALVDKNKINSSLSFVRKIVEINDETYLIFTFDKIIICKY